MVQPWILIKLCHNCTHPNQAELIRHLQESSVLKEADCQEKEEEEYTKRAEVEELCQISVSLEIECCEIILMKKGCDYTRYKENSFG